MSYYFGSFLTLNFACQKNIQRSPSFGSIFFFEKFAFDKLCSRNSINGLQNMQPFFKQKFWHFQINILAFLQLKLKLVFERNL